MSQKFRPYREIPKSAVTASDWQADLNGTLTTVEGQLDGWDYATPLAFSRNIGVTDEAILQAGLNPEDIELLAIADCPDALLRRVTRALPSERHSDGTWLVEIRFEPGELANRVGLRCALVLAQAGGSRLKTAATRVGSILWEDRELGVHLEGDSARFPTEVVSFKALLPETSNYVNAPWYVKLTFASPDEPLRRGVRVLINRDHKVAGRFVPNDPLFEELAAQLRADIVHVLVAALAAMDDSFDGYLDDSESVASLTRDMVGTVMSMTLEDAIELCRRQPSEFMARLRAETGYLTRLGAR